MCTDSLTCWPGLNRVNETDLSHILPEQAGFSCSDFVLRCFKHPSKYASRQCGYLHVCEWRYLGFSWYRDEPITFLHVFPYIFNLCPSSWVRCQEVWPFFSQALDFIYSEARCWCGCCGEKCSKDTQSYFWHPTTSIKCALSTLYNNRLCQSSPGPGPQWRKCSAFVAMRANPSSDGTSPCVLNILDTVRKHTSRTVNNSWGRCIADQISFLRCTLACWDCTWHSRWHRWHLLGPVHVTLNTQASVWYWTIFDPEHPWPKCGTAIQAWHVDKKWEPLFHPQFACVECIYMPFVSICMHTISLYL